MIALCKALIWLFNHIMYADDIVLFAPSAKGLQKTVNVCYAYGCDNYIIFNSSKSQVKFFDMLKCGHMKNIMLGQNTLHVTKSYRPYLSWSYNNR